MIRNLSRQIPRVAHLVSTATHLAGTNESASRPFLSQKVSGGGEIVRVQGVRWDRGGEFGRVDWRTIDLPPYAKMQIQRAHGVIQMIQMIQMQIQGVIQ